MMVRERHQQFQKQYGFASDTPPQHRVLDLQMLDELGAPSESVKVYRPWYGWQVGDATVEARAGKGSVRPAFWILTGRFACMILLFHPRSTKPKNRRLPLSVLYRRGPRGRED